MTKEDILGQLDEVVAEVEEAFPKLYSAGRLDAVKGTVSALKMHVEHLYDEAEREEDQDRKDGVVQKLVLAGRNMSDARDAVERGER